MRKKWRNRREQWEYALALLAEYNIEPINKRMTFAGTNRNRYFLIIHSKRLCNCILIGAFDTNEQIKAKIDMQVKISQKGLEENNGQIYLQI